jgi:mannosyltransferase
MLNSHLQELVTRRCFSFALALVLVVAAFLRVHQIGSESLWLDEAFSVEMSTSSVSTILEETGSDVHPPLYYLALKAWVFAAGNSEAAARLLSVVFSLAAIVAMYRLASLLFGRWTAVLAAVFAAISPFQIEFAQEARMYSLLALLSVLSLYLFARLLLTAAPLKSWTFAAFVIVTALMLYTQAYAWFIIAAEAATLVVAAAGRAKLAALGLALAVVLYLPWLPTQMSQLFLVQRGFWIPEGTAASFLGIVPIYGGSAVVGWLLAFCALAGVVASWFGRNERAAPRRFATMLMFTWVLCPIALPFLISQWSSPIFMAKYTIAASLAFSVLAARGVVGAFGRGGVPVAIVLVAALTWAPLTAYYGAQRKVKWRETIAALDAAATAGDVVILNQSFSEIPFRYYSHRRDLAVVPFLKEVKIEDLTAQSIGVLVSLAAGEARVWVVLSNPDGLAPQILSRLERTRTLVSHDRTWGLDVYLFASR